MPSRPSMNAYSRVTLYLPGGPSPYTVWVVKPDAAVNMSEVVGLLGSRAELGIGDTAPEAFLNAAKKPGALMEHHARVTLYLPQARHPFIVLAFKEGERASNYELAQLLGARVETGVGSTPQDAFDNAALKLAAPAVEHDPLEATLEALPRLHFQHPTSR